MDIVNTVNAISPKLMKKLKSAFPRPKIVPGFDRDVLVHKNAQYEVVEFIEEWINAQSKSK